MKRKKEAESSNRVYLKSWELKFPWITKGYGANGEGKIFFLSKKEVYLVNCLTTYILYIF